MTPDAPEAAPHRVAVFPGHTEAHPGAVRPDGYTEHTWTSALAVAVVEALQVPGDHPPVVAGVFDRGPGSYAKAVRDGQVAAANAWRADLVLEIHANASPPGKDWSGSCVLHWPRSRTSSELARDMSAAMAEVLGIRDRGAIPQGRAWNGTPPGETIPQGAVLWGLRNTRCPSVLLETHFLSNDGDHQVALDKLPELASVIASVALDFLASRV